MNQVNAEDIPILDSGGLITATTIEGALQEIFTDDLSNIKKDGSVVFNNAAYFKWRNAANSADINVLRVDGSDNTHLLAASGKQLHIYEGSSQISVFSSTGMAMAANMGITLSGTGMLTLSGNPTASFHAATKEYVDSVSQGLDFQASVLSFWDASGGLPSLPNTGDRYICSGSGSTWTINYIYEYNGVSWNEVIPTEGTVCWNENDDVLYLFNSSSWVKFGSTVTHANLNGLQGGSVGEYYHLSLADYGKISNWDSAYSHVAVSDSNAKTYIQNNGLDMAADIDMNTYEHINIGTMYYNQNTQGYIIQTSADGSGDLGQLYDEGLMMDNVQGVFKLNGYTYSGLAAGGVDILWCASSSAFFWKPLSMQSNKITDLANGSASSDACAYGQLSSHVSAGDPHSVYFLTDNSKVFPNASYLTWRNFGDTADIDVLNIGSDDYTNLRCASGKRINFVHDSAVVSFISSGGLAINSGYVVALYNEVPLQWVNAAITATINALKVNSSDNTVLDAFSGKSILFSINSVEVANIASGGLTLKKDLIFDNQSTGGNPYFTCNSVDSTLNFYGILDVGSNKIKSVADGTNATDVCAYGQLTGFTGSSNIVTVGALSSGSITTGFTPIGDSFISSASTWSAKQDALTFGILDTNAVRIDSSAVNSGEYGRFTASGLESRTIGEIKTDLSLTSSDVGLGNVENTTLSTWTGSGYIATVGALSSGSLATGFTSIGDAFISSASTWSAKQDALTFGIANTNAVKVTVADVATGEYARFNATGLESRTIGEIKTDLSLTKSDVGLSNVDNVADASQTALSTVTSGDVTAIDSIGKVASKTSGDIFYWTTSLQRLAKGTAGQFLMMNSGATAPEWNNPDILNITHSVTSGYCVYMNGATPSLADADTVGTMPAIGISLGSNQIRKGGIYNGSFTAGAIYCVGTDGSLVKSGDAAYPTTGDFLQRIGVAISTTELLLMISIDVGEIS